MSNLVLSKEGEGYIGQEQVFTLQNSQQMDRNSKTKSRDTV